MQSWIGTPTGRGSELHGVWLEIIGTGLGECESQVGERYDHCTRGGGCDSIIMHGKSKHSRIISPGCLVGITGEIMRYDVQYGHCEADRWWEVSSTSILNKTVVLIHVNHHKHQKSSCEVWHMWEPWDTQWGKTEVANDMIEEGYKKGCVKGSMSWLQTMSGSYQRSHKTYLLIDVASTQ